MKVKLVYSGVDLDLEFIVAMVTMSTSQALNMSSITMCLELGLAC